MTRDLAELLLLCFVLTPGLSPPRMMASARVFYRMQQSEDHSVQPHIIEEAVSLNSVPSSGISRRTVEITIQRLCSSSGLTQRVREADLARELNIDPAHLGRCLRTQTGLGFRDWYLAVTLRAVLPPLICTDQPLKSIAEDPALGALGTRQLTRSIVKTFGLSPGALRRRARTLGVDKVVVSTDSSAQVLS